MLWELQAITAVVVGGTALRGGVGRIWGTICGAFMLEIVGNIMVLSNFVSEYLIGAMQGTIIIIAMLVQRSAGAEDRETRPGSSGSPGRMDSQDPHVTWEGETCVNDYSGLRRRSWRL